MSTRAGTQATYDDGPQLDRSLYQLLPTTQPPSGYPREPSQDAFAEEPFAVTFAERRDAFFAHALRNPAPVELAAVFHELARLTAGGPVYTAIVEAALDHIEARRDCADFVLHAILRLLYQYPDHPQLPPPVWTRMRDAVLGFKYWPDEPGVDSLCTWTENHQILFASAAFLAGGLFPDSVFTNTGATGLEKREVARQRIAQWLDLRFRTGFSEWLSHVYYDEDLTPLLNLVDFANDPEIETRAAMVIDLLFLDMALNSFRGVFGSTHGRSYVHAKKWAAQEGTSATTKLAFGTGSFGPPGNLSAVCLALSRNYRVPAVLFEIANERHSEVMLNRQRMSIRLAEARRWGLGFDTLDDGMVLLSLEAYTHPLTLPLFIRMMDAFNWWESDFFTAFKKSRGLIRWLRKLGLLSAFARLFEHDLTRNLREEAHTLTYRTPDYMLSSAQDWRPGYGGDQQHIWQATLGPDAVCFTTHPGPPGSRSPGYWTGTGTLPRVAQIGNVAIAIYHIDRRPAIYVQNRSLFTHAWLPRDRFDEVREEAGWVFTRRAEGYLALRSREPVHWQTEPGDDHARELIAHGRDHMWICELGREAENGSFDGFIAGITRADLHFGKRRVAYASPSQGLIEFGWTGPLRRNGDGVTLADYPRYDNPYVQAPFPPNGMTIRHNGHELMLDWRSGMRSANSYVP